MAYAPCQNQECKSYGKPHPNCHCYGEMADGGKAQFCSEARKHSPECEYFVEGGPVADSPTWEKTTAQEQPTWDNTETSEQAPTWDNTKGQYDTLPQQIGAGLEGIVQGVAGPLATLAEKGLNKAGISGFSDEDIKGRQEANPITHGLGETAGFAGSLLTGYGEAAIAAKLASKVLPKSIPFLGKIGSTALKGALTNASIGAGNEASKWMIGAEDPSQPVASALANMGINGLIGGIFEGAGGLANEASKLAAENKIGQKAASWLAGLGAKASGEAAQGTGTELRLLDKDLLHEPSFQAGLKSYDKLVDSLTGKAAGLGAGYAISHIGPAGYAAFEFAKNSLQKYLKKPIDTASSLVVPTVTKWLSEGAPTKIIPLLEYANHIDRGNRLMSKGVDSLFLEGNQQISRAIDKEKERERLYDWLENGGVNKDILQESENQVQNVNDGNYATGGIVNQKESNPGIFHQHPISTVYPDHDMLLQSAKGRISNYLQSIKPQNNQSKLAFDKAPLQKDKQRSYNKALDIAIQPLSILDSVNKGTLDAEQVSHFKNLYPEVDNLLQRKLTERITKAQLKGERPNYKTRQGLSLLMRTPLSGELLPQNIQAAQSVFQPMQPQQQPQPVTKNKKNTSTLTKSSQAFLTGNQARAQREQQRS